MDLMNTLQGVSINYVTNMHEQGQRDRDVKIFSIRKQRCFFIPHKIENFFPVLQELEIESSGLRKVYRENFANLPNLRTVSLPDNEIEHLPGDLFSRNPQIMHIDVSRNQIKSIGHELFENLYQLEFLKFDDNICFEGFEYFETDVALIRDEVLANCSAVVRQEKKIKSAKNDTGNVAVKQQQRTQSHATTTTGRSLITTLRATTPSAHLNEIAVGRRKESLTSESTFHDQKFLVICSLFASILLTFIVCN